MVDGNPNDKLDAKTNAYELSKQIKDGLAKISLDNEDDDEKHHDIKERLFNEMAEFAKNCKRRKGKKIGNSANSDL